MSKQINNLNSSLEDQLHLNEKQDKTDNNLKTKDKTIIGAINEIQNSYASAEYVDVNLKMTSGDLTKLQTSNKNNLVGAINELFQNVDSGKQLIADAIDDSSITKNSTFAAMGEAIEGIRADIENTRNTLAGLMQEGGYDIKGNERIDSLLDLLVLSGISISDIKQIACGSVHTMILKNDGTLWSCGANHFGQLGFNLNNSTESHIFTQVTTNINNDVKQVACGNSHTFILKNDGSVWACGQNSYGQLGLGNKTNQKTFTKVTISNVKQIACGSDHTFILKTDGSIWACGNNEYGQLGLNDTANRTAFSRATTNINNVKQIACGNGHTVIIKNDGSIWSCGYNNRGQLGLGNKTNQKTFTQVTNNINNDVKQVFCEYYHTFILKNDGSLWGCGYNDSGQLGLNDINDRTTFTQATTNINNDVKQVFCSRYHTFILKTDGTVWTCGYNSYGQLGLGDTTDRTTFTQVPRGL